MFFKPKDSVLADVIPFYTDGKFYLYYLRDYRDAENHGEGVAWHLLTTDNFNDFKECGEVVARGEKDEQDLYIFTGSVISKEEKFYLFYTAHNPHFAVDGKSQEKLALAVGGNPKEYEKIKTFSVPAPKGYEKDDFRDPYVYLDDTDGLYKMIVAARKKQGEFYRRGCLLQAASCDLINWKFAEKPFYAPDAFFMHECPDLFKMGDWFYLVFSEFNDKFCTRYRMAKSINGPWIAPPVDTFDNRSFYAGKTAADKDGNRYIFGWNPTREGGRDYAPWQWGGSLVVHKVCQRADGTLYAACPESVKRAFAFGKVKEERESYKFVPSCYTRYMFGGISDKARIDLKFKYAGGGDFGVLLNASEDMKHCYAVKIDPRSNRLCFDRSERPQADMQFMVESERTVFFAKGKEYEMTVLIDGSVAEVYIDGETAMSVRMYDFNKGDCGVYGNFADAELRGVKIYNK